MKSIIVLLLLSQLLILASFSSCNPITTTTSTNHDAVIDSFYADMRFDKKYFLADSFFLGGGVSRGPNGKIVQLPSTEQFGMPVVFKSMNPDLQEEIIRENMPLNIAFYNQPGTVWKVEGFPGTLRPLLLSSKGVEGNPLDESTWFQIKKASFYSYKLVFCPKGVCSDVGHTEVDGERRLAVITGTSNFFIVFHEDRSPSYGPYEPLVYDGFLNPLTSKSKYYIMDVSSLDGGGIIRSGPDNALIQTANVHEFGMPVVFNPKNKQINITQSSSLTIKFYNLSGNSVWKVENYFPRRSGSFFLSSNGKEGWHSSWFQFKRTNYCSFKLRFCPFKRVTSCTDVGFEQLADGRKRLTLIPTGTLTNFRILFLKPDPSPNPVAIDSYLSDLRSDRKYYVVHSLGSIFGGGVYRGPNNELIQTTDPALFGMTVYFKPLNQKEVITESTPLSIEFTSSSSTSGSVWKVEGFPGTSGPYLLSSNGVQGEETSLFQLEKASYFSFKLLFCPKGTTCSEVGLTFTAGGRLVLSTGSTNFPMVFVPDRSSVAKSSI